MPWIDLVAQRRPQPPQGVNPPENAKDWYRIQNSADETDATDVLIYSSIGGWFGMWADEFVDELKSVTTSKINLRLNSPGGSVFDGIAIANAIRSHPATVTVYVDSLAASIASVIAMSGDRLVMMPQSQIMVHNASGSCYGDSTEMAKMAQMLDKQSRNIAEAYAQHTGGSLAEWTQYMADETWFTADEAVAVGLADEVVPMRTIPVPTAPEPDSAEARMFHTWDLSMFRYAGREQAPAPSSQLVATVTPPAAAEPLAGSTQGFDLFAQYTEQLTALVRATVRTEIAEVFSSTAPAHSTSVEDGTWDAGANEKRLPSPVPLATVKKMYTYWDESQVEDGAVAKTACKLPHHFVSADGSPGAASANGVRNALARLPQTQGLSDAERSAAEAHLRKHLNAFDGGDEEDHAHPGGTEAHEHTEHTPKFAVGDRVKITVTPHEEGQDTGTVAEINDGPAYGIRFDNADGEHDEGDVHRWYVEDELETTSESPPPDEGESTETHDEADPWTQVIGSFVSPPTSPPSADDVFAQLKGAW